MVLERVFSAERTLESFWYAMFIAVLASVVGILIARFIFGANSGIVSVMFTSLLLIFVLKDVFQKQEKLEENRPFTIREFLTNNKTAIKTYVAIFLGVFVAYYLVSFLGVLLGYNVISILREQLLLDAGLVGQAGSNSGIFLSIVKNNWWIILASFLLSFIAGSGGAFFFIWNASAWATIFGFRAAAASIVLNTNPFVTAFVMQALTLPHTFIEGMAYVLASIAGAIISSYVVSSKKKMTVFVSAFFVLLLLFWGISNFLRMILPQMFFTIFMIAIFVGILALLGYLFKNEKHRDVYKYNYYLFIVALGIFIFGAILETFVLTNVLWLDKYYSAAYIYATIG